MASRMWLLVGLSTLPGLLALALAAGAGWFDG
jgi:hypothetical protein